MLKNFKPFDKETLLKEISGIDISLQDNLVVTKYFDVLKSITKVSKRYEIFDIKSFMNEKIELISSNFDIVHYRLIVKRGIQYLTLVSDAVEINGSNFYKCFFILNSSDKSRRLSLNMGLYQDSSDVYFITSIKNMSLYKKHLTGISSLAEDVAKSIDGETFEEQITAIKNIVGERVMLSNVRDIIVDEDLKINHKKFDAFKNMLLWNAKLSITGSQESLLRTPSEKIVFNATNDISMDAFLVFNLYMQIFRNQDAHVVKKETDRIMSITQCFIRSEKLKELLLEI